VFERPVRELLFEPVNVVLVFSGGAVQGRPSVCSILWIVPTGFSAMRFAAQVPNPDEDVRRGRARFVPATALPAPPTGRSASPSG
jgi:hypothetical protein